MARIKAETLEVVCCNNLRYPLTVECDYQSGRNIYCDVKHGDFWETGIHCAHSKVVPSFLERTYRSFEAYEHESNYDYLHGCWFLRTKTRDYICSYLEIDGYVYCDVRGKHTGYDPRLDSEAQ